MAQTPPVEKLLYTKKDAAFALSVSIRTLEYYLARKQITGRRLGGRTMIPVVELRRFARCDHPVVTPSDEKR